MVTSAGRFRRGDCFQRREQARADLFGDRHRPAYVPNRVLDFGRRLLAVIDLLTVQIDLEATLADRCQRYANLAIAPRANLSCHTGSLPEVPSRDAVLNLQVNLTFGHLRPPGSSVWC